MLNSRHKASKHPSLVSKLYSMWGPLKLRLNIIKLSRHLCSEQREGTTKAIFHETIQDEEEHETAFFLNHNTSLTTFTLASTMYINANYLRRSGFHTIGEFLSRDSTWSEEWSDTDFYFEESKPAQNTQNFFKTRSALSRSVVHSHFLT